MPSTFILTYFCDLRSGSEWTLFDFLKFPVRGQVLTNHLAGIRILYMLSTKVSFSSYLQYNSAIEKAIANFRFRYNPREGTDLYLVYNEGRNLYPERPDPPVPGVYYRGFLLKFVRTFW